MKSKIELILKSCAGMLKCYRHLWIKTDLKSIWKSFKVRRWLRDQLFLVNILEGYDRFFSN